MAGVGATTCQSKLGEAKISGRLFRICVYVATFGAASLIFLFYPQIDISVSAFFFEPGQGFALGSDTYFQAVRGNLTAGLAAIAAGILGFYLSGRLNGRQTLFLILSMLVGPGLLVNVVLKDHWGRARPGHIVEFGGKKTFTPALVMSDQCDHNCSFVAGDPATGFWFLAPAFLLKRRRVLATGAALISGLGLGLGRIAQGGHFLSDVIFCGLLMVGLIWLLHQTIIRPIPPISVCTEP